MRQTLERLQEMRREAASKIVTPGSPGFGVPPSSGKFRCLIGKQFLNPTLSFLARRQSFCSKVWIAVSNALKNKRQKSRCILIRHNGFTTSPPEIPLRQKDSATN